jgi:hypothetical protein
MSLLEEYYRKAFEEGDDRYLGEIAGKLRLLVVRGKRNRPLLLDFMEKVNSSVKVSLDSPIITEPITIDEYLDQLMLFVRLKDGPISFTNREFVLAWAQQHGAAHEDIAHDRGYAASRALNVEIFGQPSHKWNLGAVARTVISVANSFLQELTVRGLVVQKSA